jgi:hypothetical protein
MDPCFQGFLKIKNKKFPNLWYCKIGEFLQDISKFSRTYTSRKTENFKKILIFWFREIEFFFGQIKTLPPFMWKRIVTFD